MYFIRFRSAVIFLFVCFSKYDFKIYMLYIIFFNFPLNKVLVGRSNFQNFWSLKWGSTIWFLFGGARIKFDKKQDAPIQWKIIRRVQALKTYRIQIWALKFMVNFEQKNGRNKVLDLIFLEIKTQDRYINSSPPIDIKWSNGRSLKRHWLSRALNAVLGILSFIAPM